MINFSTFLKWDSEFFGKQIAQINGCDSEDSVIKEEISSLFHKGMECIYLTINRSIDLSQFDSILADRKRTYINWNPVYQKIQPPGNILIQSPYYLGRSSDLYSLAIQSGEYSRFKLDSHFTIEEFKNLYKIWVDNSLTEGYSDYVITAVDSMPIGFISAKIKGDRIKIGLFATDWLHRGKGIGTLLMRQILNEASAKFLKVEVVTQADNLPACRFYEKLGFIIEEEILVYHVWSDLRNSPNIE